MSWNLIWNAMSQSEARSDIETEELEFELEWQEEECTKLHLQKIDIQQSHN